MINAKNYSIFVLNTTSYTLLKSIIFNIILRAFIRDLNNQKIRKKVIRKMMLLNRFFSQYLLFNKRN